MAWPFRIAGCGLLLCITAAAAQPVHTPTESVTVTGTRSREALQGFVQSFAAPTRAVGKIARWQDGICPAVEGVRPAAVKFVIQRVREVAAKVGAPVNADSACKPNIQIVFTTVPQAFIDNIRKTKPELLGYYDNLQQRDALATVSHPVQAWYSTETKDLRSERSPDVSAANVFGIASKYPYAHSASVTGSRLGDGLRSALHKIIIVADPNALLEHEIGTLADYISVLALTQLKSPDVCQQLPSIVNLLAQGCAQQPGAMTSNDEAYLRGLYSMGPDRTLHTQQDDIAYRMNQVLEGRE